MTLIDGLSLVAALAVVVLPLVLARWLLKRAPPPDESERDTRPTMRHGDAEP